MATNLECLISYMVLLREEEYIPPDLQPAFEEVVTSLTCMVDDI